MTAEINDRLREKLSQIRAGNYKPADFIIADAKDADMGGGIGALSVHSVDGGSTKLSTAANYRTAIKKMMDTGLIDIMLTSLSSAEFLNACNVFSKSDVTQAIRLNDATDIWNFVEVLTARRFAIPFRTIRLKK